MLESPKSLVPPNLNAQKSQLRFSGSGCGASFWVSISTSDHLSQAVFGLLSTLQLSKRGPGGPKLEKMDPLCSPLTTLFSFAPTSPSLRVLPPDIPPQTHPFEKIVSPTGRPSYRVKKSVRTTFWPTGCMSVF